MEEFNHPFYDDSTYQLQNHPYLDDYNYGIQITYILPYISSVHMVIQPSMSYSLNYHSTSQSVGCCRLRETRRLSSDSITCFRDRHQGFLRSDMEFAVGSR